MYRHFFKRLLDTIVALILLVLTIPFTFFAAIALAFSNQGNVFFVQQRPGQYGKPFSIIKFKTMNDRKDSNGELLPDAVRLTPAGKFIRKTSIDELPQLVNVLKGDISLIGPRPLLMEYLPLYTPHQARRHEVKPGISGWAQVNGRNAISWEQKFNYDVWYVDNQSFFLDLKIFFLTIYNIVKSDGISAENNATMEKFRGSENK